MTFAKKSCINKGKSAIFCYILIMSFYKCTGNQCQSSITGDVAGCTEAIL